MGGIAKGKREKNKEILSYVVVALRIFLLIHISLEIFFPALTGFEPLHDALHVSGESFNVIRGKSYICKQVLDLPHLDILPPTLKLGCTGLRTRPCTD
jgi:hypothetical protein